MTTLHASVDNYVRRVSLILTTVVGIHVGYSAVFPYLPVIRAELGLSNSELAMFVGAFAVTKIGGQPLGGHLVQRWGARTTGASALGLAAIGMSLAAWADSAVPAIAGRLLWGLGDGVVVPVLYRGISALSQRHGRDSAQAFAKLGTVAVLSMALGPFLVAAVHDVASYRSVLTAVAVFTMVNAVLAWFVLAVADQPDGGSAAETATALDVPSLLLFAGVDFGANLLWGAMEVIVPLHLAETVSDPTLWAALVLCTGLTAFAVASPVAARLPEPWRAAGTIPAGLGVIAVALAGLYGVAVPVIGLTAIVFFMFGQAHVYLVARGGIERYCGGTGKAWGFFGACSEAGFIVGPVLGTFLFQTHGAASFPLLGLGTVGVAAVLPSTIRRWRAREPGPDSVPTSKGSSVCLDTGSS